MPGCFRPSNVRGWLVVFFSLVLGVSRGFLLPPAAGGLGSHRHHYCNSGRSGPKAREPMHGGVVCRTADGENGAEGGGEEGGAKDGDKAFPNPEGAGEEGTREDWSVDEETLWRMFPSTPEPPTPVLRDPSEFTDAQLMMNDDDEVSYGGVPAATRAIEDFERSERNRLHIAIARRVLALNREGAPAADVAQGRRRFDPPISRTSTYVSPDDHLKEANYEWDKHPKLITFSAFGLLYNWTVPLGVLLRDALMRVHKGVALRLPGPGAFEFHFKNTFKETSYHLPCYGLKHNVSTWEWWFHVYTDTYLKTMLEYDMPEELITPFIDDIVDELYYEVMVGPEAYELVPQVKVVLDTMASWRDIRGGPKLAVVANDDERLRTTLENMGILDYFDFVLTSGETGVDMADEELFELALETADLDDSTKAIHIGSDYENDVVPSCGAGFEACVVKARQPFFEQRGEMYEYHRVIRIGELLHRFDLPNADPEYLMRRRGNFWEEPDESDEDDPSKLYSLQE